MSSTAVLSIRTNSALDNFEGWPTPSVQMTRSAELVYHYKYYTSYGERRMDSQIKLEIELVGPPPKVGFCLQNKKKQLSDYQLSVGENIRFSLMANVKRGSLDAPNFLGEYMQGTPKQRFIYICVGEYAGQKNFEWSRRVKIHLSSITWQQVEQVQANPKSKLRASYQATDKHGGPSCASVPLVDDGWCVVNG